MLILNLTTDFDVRYLSGKVLRVLFPAGPDDLIIKNTILLEKNLICFLKSYGAGVDPFWDLKKRVLIFWKSSSSGPGLPLWLFWK